MRKVTVIIPVYNAGNVLEKCIDSIVNQTYTEWELLLIDDGSTDDSGKICDLYAQKDNRIKVFHSENRGVSSARNIGIDNATGDYILFADSDDYISSNAMEILVARAEDTNADLVMFGFTYFEEEQGTYRTNVIDSDFAGNNKQFLKDLFSECINKEYINPPWNKLIKYELVSSNNIRFNESYSICEDMAFSIQLLTGSSHIAMVNESLYTYVYKKGDNLVNKFHTNFYEALCFFDDCKAEYFEKWNEELGNEALMNDFFSKRVLVFIDKLYRLSGYSNSKKYHELKRVCDSVRQKRVLKDFKHKNFSQKMFSVFVRLKWFGGLHLLYLLKNYGKSKR